MVRSLLIRFAALAALVASATGASAATVAPLWSPPQNLNTPSVFVDFPDVVVAADGRALATWREGGVPVRNAPEPQDAWRIAVREPGQIMFGPARHAPNFATPLIPYAFERVVALDTHRRSRGRISLRARFGNSSGEFGPPRTISTFGD